MFVPSRENLAFLQGLIISGLQVNEIADYLECNRKTVSRWKARYFFDLNSFLVDNRTFNRGANKLTYEEIQNVRLLSELDPFKPATQIKEELFLDCHDETIRRAMKVDLDIHCFSAARKNKLINLDKQRRMQFAQNHLHFTEEQWRKVIFMDEKVFSTHKDGRLMVWRPKNTR